MQTKFTLLFAMVVCATVTSKAQVSKGNILLGGNLGLSSSTQKDETENKNTFTSFSVAPSVGTVYKNNRVICFIMRYRYLGNGLENKDLNTHSFGAGLYVRQYKPLGKGFYIFAQESLNTDCNHYRGLYSSPEVVQDRKETNVFLAINPGLAYDLSKKLQVELLFFNNLISAGYMHSNVTYEPGNSFTDYKENNVYVNSNLDLSQVTAFNIGMKIFLSR